MVATPLGPNQAMKAFVARVDASRPERDPDRDRPREQQRERDDPDGRPAVAEQAVERQQRAEHDEDAELDDLDDVVRALLERVGEIGAADPERDRAHEDGDEAVAAAARRPSAP